MTAYELEAEMTDKQTDNVIAQWKSSGSCKLGQAERLIFLGDSKKLAVATIMLETEFSKEMYIKQLD